MIHTFKLASGVRLVDMERYGEEYLKKLRMNKTIKKSWLSK